MSEYLRKRGDKVSMLRRCYLDDSICNGCANYRFPRCVTKNCIELVMEEIRKLKKGGDVKTS